MVLSSGRIRRSLDTECSCLQNIAIPGDITKPLAQDTFKSALEAYSIGVHHLQKLLPAGILRVTTMPSSAYLTAAHYVPRTICCCGDQKPLCRYGVKLFHASITPTLCGSLMLWGFD